MKEILMEKVYAEESVFIAKMMTRSSAEIIDAAFEITYRKEIIMLLETSYFPEDQLKKLAQLSNPVAACYNAWTDWTGDDLEACIDNFLEEL